MDILVGPIHFRHVHQALYAFFDLSEAAIVGEVGDRCHNPSTLGITTHDICPRIITQLLHTKADAIFFAVELQNTYVDFVAYVDHFTWVTNTLPRHISDVQQAVNATEIDERAVVGQILNDTLNVLAFLHGSQQLFTLVAIFFFQHRTA